MQQSFRRFTVAAAMGAMGVLALPALAGAQRPEPRELPRADATRIIGMRRELDLTPRQLTQLDSIERATVAARRANAERMRVQRDSMRPSMRSRGDSSARLQMRDRFRAATPEARLAMRDSLRASGRARVEAMRPQMEQMRHRDSTSRAAAERVLNDSQRQRLREVQAEERGRQRGLREARAGRAGQGMRGGRSAGARGGMQPRTQPRMQPGRQGGPRGARGPVARSPRGDAGARPIMPPRERRRPDSID